MSVGDDLARACGLRVGGMLSFLVLGRIVEARIANIRRMGALGPWTEFSFILSAGTLDAFPPTHIAFVHADGVAAETRFLAALAEHFPTASVIRVRDVLAAIRETLDSIVAGIRVVAAVTLAAGVLVLAGAIAAGQQARIRDAVVLKDSGCAAA